MTIAGEFKIDSLERIRSLVFNIPLSDTGKKYREQFFRSSIIEDFYKYGRMVIGNINPFAKFSQDQENAYEELKEFFLDGQGAKKIFSHF